MLALLQLSLTWTAAHAPSRPTAPRAPAARAVLLPQSTPVAPAAPVAELTAATEVLAVEEPPPPPNDPRITAQFSERPHGFSEGASSASQGRQGFSDSGNTARQRGGFSEGSTGFSDRNPTVRDGAKFGMGKAVDSRKGQMVGQFQEQGHQVQEQGHAISDKSQSFSEGSGRSFWGWGKKKERKDGPRGRAGVSASASRGAHRPPVRALTVK